MNRFITAFLMFAFLVALPSTVRAGEDSGGGRKPGFLEMLGKALTPKVTVYRDGQLVSASSRQTTVTYEQTTDRYTNSTPFSKVDGYVDRSFSEGQTMTTTFGPGRPIETTIEGGSTATFEAGGRVWVGGASGMARDPQGFAQWREDDIARKRGYVTSDDNGRQKSPKPKPTRSNSGDEKPSKTKKGK